MTTSDKPWEKLPPGKTWRGRWETGVAGFPALPVLAARGVESGHTLLVTGGVHGDEYEGPAAIHALFRELNPAQLRGRLLGLPVINTAAWEARSRFTPADGADLNRAFPGTQEEAKCPTEALAGVIFQDFVSPCDVLIDLHSGGVKLVHLPLIGWYAGGSKEAERLARGFGETLHPWLVRDVQGVLSAEAHRAGKVALGAEWMGGGRLDPEGVKVYSSGVRRVMAALGMLPLMEESPSLDTRPPIAGDYQQTPVAGLFLPRVALGERVDRGTVIGVMHDPVGEQVAEIQAERDGIVAGLAHLAYLQPGERVAYVG